MAIEIERRFLVRDASVVRGLAGIPIVQGYLAKNSGEMSTRVRIAHGDAWITLKSPRIGMMREEFEYPIPLHDARALIGSHCAGGIVRKTRYRVLHRAHLFEVDVFEGPLAGLVVAEIELSTTYDKVIEPPWLGVEITGDYRYGNRALAQFGLPRPCASTCEQAAPLQVE
ncbi:MAG: CYTH domain-containing protein [Rhodocyclaceae bacterium]